MDADHRVIPLSTKAVRFVGSPESISIWGFAIQTYKKDSHGSERYSSTCQFRESAALPARRESAPDGLVQTQVGAGAFGHVEPAKDRMC